MTRLRLRVEIDREPDDRPEPYLVTVTCMHGETRQRWRRTCGNGCHRHGAGRKGECSRINPTREVMTLRGILAHGKRLLCGCDGPFWMLHGPRHEEAVAFEVQEHDMAVRGEFLEELRESVRATREMGL